MKVLSFFSDLVELVQYEAVSEAVTVVGVIAFPILAVLCAVVSSVGGDCTWWVVSLLAVGVITGVIGRKHFAAAAA